MYSDCFIWCVSCTMLILTSLEICGCVFCNVWVFWQYVYLYLPMRTYIYCVLYCFVYLYFNLIVLSVLV